VAVLLVRRDRSWMLCKEHVNGGFFRGRQVYEAVDRNQDSNGHN
jgi:hypothetical protein